MMNFVVYKYSLQWIILQVSKKYFPELAVGFDDHRVHLQVGDGIHLYNLLVSFKFVQLPIILLCVYC